LYVQSVISGYISMVGTEQVQAHIAVLNISQRTKTLQYMLYKYLSGTSSVSGVSTIGLSRDGDEQWLKTKV